MLFFNYNYQLKAAFLFGDSSMQRMKSRMNGNRWAVAIVAVAALLMVKPIFAQDVSETRLADGIFMLEGQGGNMMLVATESHTVLVDAQFARMAEAIGAKVEALGSLPLSYLINTHFHGDHVGGNAYMSETLGATILAHANVLKRLADDTDFPREGLPTETLTDRHALDLGEYSLTLKHYPTAHTDGDIVIWVDGQNIVHVGDLYFVDRFPFVDLNSGGTVQGYIDAINSVLADADEHTQIIPGHGPLATATDYIRLRDMMIETREQLRAWHAAGADVDTMVATGLDEKWAEWTWNFINEERWIRTLFNDLQASH